ncbi:MAG: BLUF domain-containing protein [Geminicoccaceae bacterium]|nr:BLUF domain-containing protein [Geminicoccaceae bacterium]
MAGVGGAAGARSPEAEDGGTTAPSRPVDHAEPLAFFAYASRVRGSWTRTRELFALVHAAAERNRARDVTGLLILHHGRIRQWLEGPPTAIGELRRLIVDDPRHEILAAQEAAVLRRRRFPAWSMHLACAAEDVEAAQPCAHDLVTLVPAALLEQRLPTPATIPLQLGNCVAATLCPGRDRCVRAGEETPANCPGLRPIATGRGFGLPQPVLLASAALQGPAALRHWLPRSACDVTWDALADIVGAAIDCLGAAWREDRLSGAEVTLALAELYRALRPICTARDVPDPRGRVLIATLAGSSASIGPMLRTELLRRAGWQVPVRHELEADALARAIEESAPAAVLVAGSRPFATTRERAELARFLARPRGGTGAPILLGATLGGSAATLGATVPAVERALAGRAGGLGSERIPFAASPPAWHAA